MLDVLTSPSPEAIRAAITEQMCPFCGKGPWRVVAGHVWRAHQIPARQFREMADLPWSAKIASAEHSAKMAAMAIEHERVAAMAGTRVSGVAQPLSKAGRERLRAGGGMSGRQRKVPVEAHPVIARRVKSGESLNAVGRDYGISGNQVRNIVRFVSGQPGRTT